MFKLSKQDIIEGIYGDMEQLQIDAWNADSVRDLDALVRIEAEYADLEMQVAALQSLIEKEAA